MLPSSTRCLLQAFTRNVQSLARSRRGTAHHFRRSLASLQPVPTYTVPPAMTVTPIPTFRPAPPPPAQHANFDLIQRVDLDYAPGMSVEKWKSRVTGLTVLWANFESPLLNSYITLATEIFADSGVPHTLEHLIFLGSQQYPYKGVLDSLANRAFAQGTNAWTAQDHTAYTLTTAGSDGFLRMLPIYLDHVFFPTLTGSGFTTEVYHINEKGQDAGVVYSEMQGRENTPGDLMELKLQRMLYPPSSAYRSETGGLMSALRVLSVDEIRSYHHQYYAPHNAALVVCGPLDRAELLDTLGPVEDRIVAANAAHGLQGPQGWKRPFLETGSAVPPVIDGKKIEVPGLDNADPPGKQDDNLRRRAFVPFPEKDESVGEIEVTWVGPAIDDWLENEAISILGNYLTDSAVSPVQKEFVERDDPLCTDVYMGITDKAGRSTLNAYFASVPFPQLDELDFQFIDLLKRIAKEGIDQERMRIVIKRARQKVLSALETKPADAFADVVISDFLYGKADGSDLAPSMADMERLDTLSTWNSSQWVSVLQRHYIDNTRLVVIGQPSAALAEKLKAETKALTEKRQRELGKEGLKKLGEQLEEAKKDNDKDIPPEMLDSFKVPDVSSINWITVGTARNEPVKDGNEASLGTISDLDRKVQQHVDADGATLPFFVQYDHVSSAFVTVNVLFSTTDLAPPLRRRLQLYLSSLFSLPVTRQDGTSTKLTYEEVVKGLDDDVLSYDGNLGVGSGFAEMLTLEIKCEKANYVKAIQWIRDLLWGAVYDVERLRITGAKIAQSLPEQKRDGRTISWSLARNLTYSSDLSSNLANSLLSIVESTPITNERLQNDPQSVVDELELIRKTLLRPENMRVSVAGDILGMEKPRSAWSEAFQHLNWTAQPIKPVRWAKDVLSDLGKQPAKKGLICPLPSIESSYAVFTSRGIPHYTHPDNAALIVTLALLNAMESFLWRYIRGAGLAYGASLRSDPEAQHLHFSLYRSPDSARAFLEARKVIEKLASGEIEMDNTMVESAKSSLHYSVAEAEGTVGSAAAESFVDAVIKGVGKGRAQRLLLETSRVTLADVRASLSKYVLPVFSPATSVCAIVSTPARVDEMADSLRAIGYDVALRDLDFGADDEGGSGESGSEESDESMSDGEASR